MEYLRVKWLQDSPDYPIDIYSELDNNRMEVRKIEFFANNRVNYFDSAKSSEGLGEIPLPSLVEIMKQEEFIALKIDKSFFDLLWSNQPH